MIIQFCFNFYFFFGQQRSKTLLSNLVIRCHEETLRKLSDVPFEKVSIGTTRYPFMHTSVFGTGKLYYNTAATSIVRVEFDVLQYELDFLKKMILKTY